MPARPHGQAVAGHLPRLPAPTRPRRRPGIGSRTRASGAATLLVGPGGAGKTLGVAGWLRETGRGGDVDPIRADTTWDTDPAARTARPREAGGRRRRLPTCPSRPCALDARIERDPDSPASRSSRAGTRRSRARGFRAARSTACSAASCRSRRRGVRRAGGKPRTPTHAAEVSARSPAAPRAGAPRVVMTARAVVCLRRPGDGRPAVRRESATVAGPGRQRRVRHPPAPASATSCSASPGAGGHARARGPPDLRPAVGEARSPTSRMGLLVTWLPDAEGPATPSTRLLAGVVRAVRRRRVDVPRAAATVQRAVPRRGTRRHRRRVRPARRHRRPRGRGGATREPRDLPLLMRGHGAGIHRGDGPPVRGRGHARLVVHPALERWSTDAGGRRPAPGSDPHPSPIRVLTTRASRLQRACARRCAPGSGWSRSTRAVEHAESVLDTTSGAADALVPVRLRARRHPHLARPGSTTPPTGSPRPQLARSRDLPAMVTVALIPPGAFTQFPQGNEAAAALAAEV